MKNKFSDEIEWYRAFLTEHVYMMDWQFVYVNGMSEFDNKLEDVSRYLDWNGEDVILVYDESLFGKGAAGFVMTYNALYDIEKNLRLEYSDITSVELGKREYIVTTADEEYNFSARRLTGEGTVEAIMCVLREKIGDA